MKIKFNIMVSVAMAFLAGTLTGCKDTKSYSDLLREEEIAVNWYLAQEDVITSAPEDSVFITGSDAPFYRMDAEGNIYMRVITEGDKKRRPKDGDRVYFSFVRKDIKSMSQGNDNLWIGNAENLGSAGGTSFVMGNTVLPSSTQYGTGIQLPMKWLGYYSEVELILKSVEGFQSDLVSCTPYIYKLRYFPAEY